MNGLPPCLRPLFPSPTAAVVDLNEMKAARFPPCGREVMAAALALLLISLSLLHTADARTCDQTHAYIGFSGPIVGVPTIQHRFHGTVTILDDCHFRVRSPLPIPSSIFLFWHLHRYQKPHSTVTPPPPLPPFSPAPMRVDHTSHRSTCHWRSSRRWTCTITITRHPLPTSGAPARFDSPI